MIKYRGPIKLRGIFDINPLYDWEDDRVSILEIQLSKRCNLGKCLYCFEDAGEAAPDELSFSEIKDVIRQAKKLSCQRVFIVGAGEPLLNPFFIELAEFVSSLDMWMVICTNATPITRTVARRLYPLNFSVVVKLDSLNSGHNNFLTQVNSWHLQMRGLKNLIRIGFNKLQSGLTRLGINAVFTQINEDDVEELSRFCKRENIWLSVDEISVVGRAVENYQLLRPERSYAELMEKLEFRPWEGYHECFYRNSGIAVRHNGDVISCPEDIDRVVGNVKENSLKDLLLALRKQEPHCHNQACPVKAENLRRFLENRVSP